MTDNPERFVIYFEPKADPAPLTSVLVYSYGKDIYVYTPENMSGTVMVYDLLGQLVASESINPQGNKLTVERSATYVVKVQGESVTVTQKVRID